MSEPTQVVLITGTSSGFGLLTAAHLSSKGYIVYATMRKIKKKQLLLSEVNAKGGAVKVLPLDVTDKYSVRECVGEIARTEGYIDVLVNNAGYGIGGFFEDLGEDEIRAQMETNFFGVQAVTREVIPLMRQRKQGKIINISSVSGFSGSPAFGAYNASKWALEGFSESLLYELKLFNINVCLIEPGTYKTQIFSDNARYAARFDYPESPYFSYSRHLRQKMMAYVHDCHKDPMDIPFLIEKIIKQKNPKFRHIPDIEGQVLYALRKFFPFTLYRALINRAVFSGFKERTFQQKNEKMEQEKKEFR